MARTSSSRRAPAGARFGTVLLLVSVLVATPRASAQEPTGKALVSAAEATLAELRQAFGNNPKKYEALAKKVEAATTQALAKTVWRTGADGRPQTFAAHPYFALIEELAAPLRPPSKQVSAAEVLTRQPWQAVLELVDGLQFGSDRPIPTHENGFIALGCPSADFPGYPELLTNRYLFGTREIVGWRHGVESKKKLVFRGRGPKDAPTLEATLPAWEALRVYLLGTLPEVPLLAIPRLTQLIEARLAERRGAGHALDTFFVLLDSRWNGFTFETPFAKERFAVVQPIGALIADQKSFLYRFPPSLGLAGSGDLPFVSDVTLSAYAAAFQQRALVPMDFIQKTPEATAVKDAFWSECAYVTRYRALLDVFVRAILAPNLAYPANLDYLDYPADTWPVGAAPTRAFDVPRAHALLVWAHARKDPRALADFLTDELLDKEPNHFPKDIALPVALTLRVRELEPELLRSVATLDPALATEFWPPSTDGPPAAPRTTQDLLAHFHAFHAAATTLIRDTARAVVAKELGK